MENLILKNIGPLVDVKIDLKKVNLIIGPQSSGKSVIAKITSYCHWVEKRYFMDGKFEGDFLEQLMIFHRLSDTYFNKGNYIEYTSDFIKIIFSGKSKEVSITPIISEFEYKNNKNIYIPAERNFVSVIPNLKKYKETNDNVMNFLFDWYEIKKEYDINKKFKILNLPITFHHDLQSDADQLILNESKELLLSHASSGLQSVIPLLLIFDFLTKNFNKTLSLNEDNTIVKILTQYFKSILNDERRKDLLNKFHKEEKLPLTEEESFTLFNLISNRRYHFTRFVIEEPEQNLFPSTQRDLIYTLINQINRKEKHSLLITTHSPYILYALNNCMLGKKVSENIPLKEKKEFSSYNSWIDPELVSVWEIDKRKGTIKSIKNEEDGTIGKHYFNSIMNEVMDEYYDMLNYF